MAADAKEKDPEVFPVTADDFFNGVSSAITLFDCRSVEDYEKSNIYRSIHLSIPVNYMKVIQNEKSQESFINNKHGIKIEQSDNKDDESAINLANYVTYKHQRHKVVQMLHIGSNRNVFVYGYKNSDPLMFEFVKYLLRNSKSLDDFVRTKNVSYLETSYQDFYNEYPFLCLALPKDLCILPQQQSKDNENNSENKNENNNESKNDDDKTGINSRKETEKEKRLRFEKTLNSKGYPSQIIKNQLYLGSARHATDPTVIDNLNITHVVNVTHDTRGTPNAFGLEFLLQVKTKLEEKEKEKEHKESKEDNTDENKQNENKEEKEKEKEKEKEVKQEKNNNKNKNNNNKSWKDLKNELNKDNANNGTSNIVINRLLKEKCINSGDMLQRLMSINENKGVLYCNINIVDDLDAVLTPHIDTVCNFIDECRKDDNNCVLVHCHQGISRSSSFVMAYLMKGEKLSLFEAYKIVKTARPIIHPNWTFFKQLTAFEKSLIDTQSDSNGTAQLVFDNQLREDERQYKDYLANPNKTQKNKKKPSIFSKEFWSKKGK